MSLRVRSHTMRMGSNEIPFINMGGNVNIV